MTDKKDKGPEGDVPKVDAEALLADHRSPIDSGAVVEEGVCVDPPQLETLRVIPGGEEGFDRFLDRAGDVHTGVRVQVRNIGPDDDDCCDDDDSGVDDDDSAYDDDDSGVDDDDSEWGSHDCQPLSAFNRVPVADINADGEPEIMLVGGDGEILVLDSNGLGELNRIPWISSALPSVGSSRDLEADRAAPRVITTILDGGETTDGAVLYFTENDRGGCNWNLPDGGIDSNWKPDAVKVDDDDSSSQE
jgi:hypothetical protein